MLGALPILPLPAPPSDGNLGPLPPAQLTDDDEKPSSNESAPVPVSVASHTRTIGIIHPPPDIRTIVDKTSQFVAKNGPEFEKRIIANNAGNVKFNFLNSSDPYHAYYQHRLLEFRAQNLSPAQQPGDSALPVATESSAPSAPPTTTDAIEAAKADLSALFKPVRKVLDPPEAEQYTVRLPEGITGEELDIIKLTAQFVARNGKSFLTGLTSREINNPQFHFLKPTHSMFMFFTSLADAYSKVLMPPKGLTDKLKKSVADMTTVLERCVNRLEWERSQEQARQKAEDEKEQERIEMAMIDWHDFVVVESIDFVDDEDEDLPPPMTIEEVIRRSKVSAMEEDTDIVEPGKEVEMEMDEEEVQLVEEGMRATSLEENDDGKQNEMKVREEPEPPMRIVKNWKRPEDRIPAERDPTKFVVSPITGELIPNNEMSEHMRISLIDPKYKEQKERMFAKIRETTLAQDDEISRNIVGLAQALIPQSVAMEVVVASSSIDGGIGCWDVHTGAEQLRYKTCVSPPHGLACVGQRFLASSQLRDPSANSGCILYWSWSKPQVEVKSFPSEPIQPVAANREGTYIVGGGVSGDIYLWEVATGRQLRKWNAHYRAVTCLVFSDDDSLLISGSEDGSVKVWSLFMIFDDLRRQQSDHLYEHNFSEHTLRVTDIVVGYGGSNAIIVSASADRTCKVWSLSKGKLLRNIVFPSIIDAIVLDPGEHVFYAGSRDGKIYIAALSAESTSKSNYGLHIINSLSNHSKAVTCLAYCAHGNLLLSGSDDGMVRVWDAKTHNIVRVFKHAKGPVNNILVVRPELNFNFRPNSQASSRRHGSLLPPALDKYRNPTDEDADTTTVIGLRSTCRKSIDPSYFSSHVINNQIKELQQQGSSAAAEMETERLKLECTRSMQMVQQWKKMYENLHQFCVNELLDSDQAGISNGNST